MPLAEEIVPLVGPIRRQPLALYPAAVPLCPPAEHDTPKVVNERPALDRPSAEGKRSGPPRCKAGTLPGSHKGGGLTGRPQAR